ncbi:MAG TPA: ATP-binding protein [Vicinamibacterales bacterium]|nr:ATP-binding protein [Vicinamibacterales bacterium]
MQTTANPHIATCLALTKAISKSRTVEEIHAAALDALGTGLGVERSSILLFDPDGVMRFKSYRGLSDTYRRAVEGHTPWRPDTPDPQPLVVADVTREPSLESFLPIFEAERIAAMTFVPLISLDRVIGKFMLYYGMPAAPSVDELQLASVIAAQVAFAIERTRTEEQTRRSEERLRFALDAASMGTWDWDLSTNVVQWSDNLEQIHGLPPGSFDGTFASYEREIHPDDRGRVLASTRRALAEGVPHDIEYRVVAPDGSVRWCEGKGRVEYQDGRPVRMSGVCMMVSRRKEAELARLATAEESNRLKDEFLATLSHELRTPLNAILGWVQMLQSGELTTARARQAIDVIGRNARLQAQLIEDILDVSRIITGKLEIERAPVSVPQLIDTAIAGVSPAADAKRITLDRRLAAELPPLEGDPKRLHQVLNNVLANSVKFTPEGGAVELDCTIDGTWLVMEIRDSGAGIAREFLPFVFDRFRQADSKSTRNHGGLGLGLAIARHLVEQHGGKISARSDGPGQGTTVSIRLPAGSGSSLGPLLTAADGGDLRLDGVAILVVEDQPDSREMLATLLENRGARVAQCDSAESAMHLLTSESVHLVIADIAMPDVDGYELIRRLRASGYRMPAVAVTAFARQDDRNRAIACGYNAYCAKPIDGSQLTRTVRELVAGF